MLTDRPLQIEVLVNSPGLYDQVRIREPFAALRKQGVDCRIHERPFRFNDCIRPHSLVIWQGPLQRAASGSGSTCSGSANEAACC